MNKTIRVPDYLHEKIKSYNRDGETMAETIERLIDGPSLRELAGVLSDEEADTFRDAIDASHEDHDREIERMYDE